MIIDGAPALEAFKHLAQRILAASQKRQQPSPEKWINETVLDTLFRDFAAQVL